ncbi:MAG: hypothetical protein ACRC6T_02245 [Sarcina sp.]
MNIKKYVKVIQNNDFCKYKKNLQKDFLYLRSYIQEHKIDNVKVQTLYYNLIIELWGELERLKNLNESEVLGNIINLLEVQPLLKIDLTLQPKLPSTDKEKVLLIREYTYIIDSAIQYLLMKKLKLECGITLDSTDYFVNTVNGNLRYIDFNGDFRYKDTLPNYFFYVFILTDNFFVYQPLTVNYELIPDQPKYKVINLQDISHIKLKDSPNANINNPIITVVSKNNSELLTIRDLRSPEVINFKMKFLEYIKQAEIPINV